MSIMAEVDIKSNEEVLVSYNYRIHQAPVWYQQLYFKHMREVEHVGEEGLYLITRRILRQHSVMIAIPPPARDSPRFLACGGCKLYHMRCTGINVDDIFDEDPAGNKVPKASSDWFSQSCTQPS
jgi:hypothetical protein